MKTKISEGGWRELENACPSLNTFMSLTVPASQMHGQQLSTTVCLVSDSFLAEAMIEKMKQILGERFLDFSSETEACTSAPSLVALITNVPNSESMCFLPGEPRMYSKLIVDIILGTLEKRQINIKVGKGASTSNITLDMPDISFFFIATSLSEIPAKLRNCIKNVIDLKSIPKELVNKLQLQSLIEETGFHVDQTCLNRLALETTIGRTLPANLLSNIIDYMQLKSLGNRITEKIIDAVIGMTSSIALSSCTVNDLDRMNPGEFEQFIYALFTRLGYQCEHTGQSGDQGVDVIAERNDIRVGIQAKCYTGTVGNAAVQEVLAGVKYYNLDKGFVLTNSTFTASARKLANTTRVALWDRKRIADILFELEE